MGFGALLSPLIADPFLSEASCLPANATAGARMLHASGTLGQHVTPPVNQTLPPRTSPQSGTGIRVSYAFWIMALINVSVHPGQPIHLLQISTPGRHVTLIACS